MPPYTFHQSGLTGVRPRVVRRAVSLTLLALVCGGPLILNWLALPCAAYTYTQIVDANSGNSGFCREYDGVSQGTYTRTYGVSSLAACQAQCDAEPLCTGSEYTSSGQCEVHTGSICKVSVNSGANCYLTGESNPGATNSCPNLPPPPSPPPPRCAPPRSLLGFRPVRVISKSAE